MRNKGENPYQTFQRRIIELYVEHPEVKRIWNMLDSRRMFKKLSESSEESPIHLFVEGKSRVGKTQMMKRYKKLNPNYVHVDDEGGMEIDIVPVVYMNLPVPFTLKEFYMGIIKGLGAPEVRGQSVGEAKARAFKLLEIQKTEMLIIDEMDYLLASTYVTKKQSMENIKDVANNAGVCLVCVGTPAIEELRTLNEQHIGRYPPVTVPIFKECDQSFFLLLESIESQLESKVPLGLSNPESALPYLLHKLSGGLIGWLKPILREAFNILGVFSPKFNDFSILEKLDGDVLYAARQNVLGELTQKEVEKLLEG